jgi:urea transport system substrate-binding protein
MATIVVSAEERIASPPAAVFALFGAGAGAGWVFDAACDRVVAGAVVTLRVPLGGNDARPVDILGRIVSVRSPSRIVIVHDQPWRGKIRLVFDPDPDQAPPGGCTRVRLIAELDESGMRWLMRQRGYPLVDDDDGGDADHPLRLGLLTSKSGPGSAFAMAAENLASLAVGEINGDGGIAGRPLRLLIGDDATDPAVGAAEAQRLVRAGCRTILATTTSATFAAVVSRLRRSGVLVVQTLANEGGLGGELCVQLGERPADQLMAAAGPLMRRTGASRWFLAGDDYRWPRHAHSAARGVLPAAGGTVVGEAFRPLGTRDFAPLIERILGSGAELILSTFVGSDSVAFERQCHALGVRERCRTMSLAIDESTLERIGPHAAPGITAALGYFEHLASAENKDLTRRYRQAYGRWAPPMSSLTESAYEAVHLYAAAIRRVRDDEPTAIARELRAGRHLLPRGAVKMDGPETMHQSIYLADATAEGFCPVPG